MANSVPWMYYVLAVKSCWIWQAWGYFFSTRSDRISEQFCVLVLNSAQ